MSHVPKIDEYISVEDLKNFDRIEEESSENPKFKGLPNEFVPLWEPDRKLSAIGQKALQYALSRMSLEDIVSYKIGYCGLGKYKWRLVVPFFEKGEVVYFVARQIYDSPKPYDNPNKGEFGGIGADDVVFNIDGARKLGCAIVCEGVFDAIRAGEDGIALLGTDISEVQINKLLEIPDVCILLDEDAKLKALKMAKRFKEIGKIVKVAFLPNGDPADFSRSEIRKIIDNSVLYSYEFESLTLLES